MSSASLARQGGGVSPAVMALISIGVVLVLIVIGAVSLFAGINSNQRQGVQLETALSAQYLDNQNELSSYVSTVDETLGVADRASAKADAIIADAVKGRYVNGSNAKPVGGSVFSAISEAYPNIKFTTALYAKVQDAIIAGRQGYKDKQSKLLDMLRNYDSWRNSGLFHSMLVKWAGIPSSNLRAQIGNDIVTGPSAEDRMYRIVLASQALNSYETGKMQPINTNP